MPHRSLLHVVLSHYKSSAETAANGFIKTCTIHVATLDSSLCVIKTTQSLCYAMCSRRYSSGLEHGSPVNYSSANEVAEVG